MSAPLQREVDAGAEPVEDEEEQDETATASHKQDPDEALADQST